MSGRRRGPGRLPEDPEKIRESRQKLRRILEFVDELSDDLQPENRQQARQAVRAMQEKLDVAEAAFGEEALAEERELVERVAKKLGV